MTENNDFINDEFLRNLVRKSSLETPSDDFVGKVMEKIMPQTEIIPAKRPLLLYLKSFLGFLLIAAVLTGFFWTSDVPVLNWLPGKQFFDTVILQAFESLFTWVKNTSGNGKSFIIPVMILAASGLLYLLDRIIANRGNLRNYPAA